MTQTHQALQSLAALFYKKPNQSSGGSSRKADFVGQFFEVHALGLMATFADVINETSGRTSHQMEKKRCLGAIGEMIKMGKNSITNALPQVGPGPECHPQLVYSF